MLNSCAFTVTWLPLKLTLRSLPQYIGCAQVKITGGGSANPPKIALPGAYKSTDPGITVNIYNNLQSYTACVLLSSVSVLSLICFPPCSPGGAVWSG